MTRLPIAVRCFIVVLSCVLAAAIVRHDAQPVRIAAARASESADERDPVLLSPRQRTLSLSPAFKVAANRTTTDDEAADEEIEVEMLSICEAPEDPIEEGTSTLFVSLTDAATGVSVSSHLQLWRIDAPGNSVWGRGDQFYQHEGASSRYPCPFVRLPEGVYRVHAEGQVMGSKDLPSFAVGPGDNHISLALPMPRTVPVLVAILNENGVAITDASYWCRFDGSGVRTTHPDWVAPRSLRDRPAELDLFTAGGGGTYLRSWQFDEHVPIRAERGYFTVSNVSEASRVDTIAFKCSVFVPGHVTVEFETSYQFARTHVFRATTVPVASVHQMIFLPDGRRAVDADAEIQLAIEAHLDGSAVRSTGIRVVAKLDGYKRLVHRLPIGESWDRIEMVPVTNPNPEHNATMSK